MMGPNANLCIPSFVEIGPLVPERKNLKGFYHILAGGFLGHLTKMSRKKTTFVPLTKEAPHTIWF